MKFTRYLPSTVLLVLGGAAQIFGGYQLYLASTADGFERIALENALGAGDGPEVFGLRFIGLGLLALIVGWLDWRWTTKNSGRVYAKAFRTSSTSVEPMNWRDLFKRERFDGAALLALARERFPNRSEEVAARVLTVFHTQFRFGRRHLHPSARLAEDLGFDDLDFFEMLKDLEKEFKIQIPVEGFERGATLDDLMACIEQTSVQQTDCTERRDRAPADKLNTISPVTVSRDAR